MQITNFTLQFLTDSFSNSSFVIRHSSFLLTAFHPFNAQHLVTLGLIASLCILIVLTAKDAASPKQKWLGRLIGLILSGYVICVFGQQAVERTLSWQYSLPLDLCNLVLFLCLISLFRPNQWTVELAYFWGLGGGLQAMFTPDLTQGFPSWSFILFFWGHGATLIAIVFLISAGRFTPRMGSVFRMMIALNIYGLVVGILDAIMGWNYGYLCRKPSMPSLLDFLGPWPWYLLSLELIAFLSFLLLYLPWRLLVLLRKREKD
jgi:hypothetical integral membrane protein (TIGR02206 family)